MGYYDEAILAHHGILGQKWGVRRFENKNGHLTAAGKARYDGDKVTAKEKHVFSAKAAGWNALSKTQAMNAKVYSKLGNKTMASIQKTVSTQAKKNAEKAQKEADAKKAEKEANKKGLTDKQKKMIIAGAAVVGTAVAAYGGYKLYQLNKQITNSMAKRDHTEAGKLMDESLMNLKLSSNSFNLADKSKIDVAKARNEGDKVSQRLYEQARTGFIENGEQYRKAANDASKKAGELANRAKAKNYSVKEKAGYIKEQAKIDRATVSRIPIDRAQIDRATIDRVKIDRTPIGMDSFNKAVQANDDLVSSLLKKNAKALGL